MAKQAKQVAYRIFQRDTGVVLWEDYADDEMDALRQCDVESGMDMPSRYGNGETGLDWDIVDEADKAQDGS